MLGFILSASWMTCIMVKCEICVVLSLLSSVPCYIYIWLRICDVFIQTVRSLSVECMNYMWPEWTNDSLLCENLYLLVILRLLRICLCINLSMPINLRLKDLFRLKLDHCKSSKTHGAGNQSYGNPSYNKTCQRLVISNMLDLSWVTFKANLIVKS